MCTYTTQQEPTTRVWIMRTNALLMERMGCCRQYIPAAFKSPVDDRSPLFRPFPRKRRKLARATRRFPEDPTIPLRASSSSPFSIPGPDLRLHVTPESWRVVGCRRSAQWVRQPDGLLASGKVWWRVACAESLLCPSRGWPVTDSVCRQCPFTPLPSRLRMTELAATP